MLYNKVYGGNGMRNKRLDRKTLIQTRKALRQQVKNLETELAIKEAARLELNTDIENTTKTLNETKAKLATLESRN